MRFDSERNRITIAVTELARYAYQRENPRALAERFGFARLASEEELPDTPPEPEDGASFSDPETEGFSPLRRGKELHNITQTDASLIPGTQAEVPLSRTVMCGEYEVAVEGYADSISYDGQIHTVEEIKTVSSLSRNPTPFSDPSHFAQASVYASMLAESSALPEVKIRLTVLKRSGGESVKYEAVFRRVQLDRMFGALIDRAIPFLKVFAERFTAFAPEAERMPFPYPSVREGQIRFIQSAYRAMKHGKNLLVSAPTGIGKTMSALFPAVKLLGEGAADKAFCFTAKNVTGLAAMDAAHRIAGLVPHMKTVMVCSKDTVCPLKKEAKKAGLPFRMDCRACERTDFVSDDFGRTRISCRERQLNAMTELLSSEDPVFTPDRLIRCADAHRVCPYELALDLSEFCMLVVCDYNYVLDDSVRFRRYFGNPENTDRYLFLFDEAHNLPDRARDTYSAALGADFLNNLTKTAASLFPDMPDLEAEIGSFADALSETAALCDEHEYTRSSPDGDISGAYHQGNKVPGNLVRSAGKLARLLREAIREYGETGEALDPFADALRDFVFAASFFDDKFRFFAHREGDSVLCEILCLDPSGIIRRMLAAGKSSVLFSATLAPMEYFREVTGMGDADTLELLSPYEQDNLCLVACDGVSVRYADRKQTAADCAEIVSETVSAREGNYIVYFPSYEYMKDVCRAFLSLCPDCSVVMQKPGMSRREREKFMALYREENRPEGRSLVGFCVLGGMFSEGIDLTGERLIGVVIFGTGLPRLSPERNLMSAYYDEKEENGFEFAYLCPGMNKVQQAAGRVIRSENDRGVVVLADDRFGEPRMKTLFPRHWRHMKFTSDPDSLRYILDEFWEKHPG